MGDLGSEFRVEGPAVDKVLHEFELGSTMIPMVWANNPLILENPA